MRLGILYITCLLSLVSCKSNEKQLEPASEVLSFERSDVFNLASGVLYRISDFPSEFIKPRPVDVWIPDGFSKEKSYAVLYMHDGQMLFDSTATWNKQEWQVDEIASRLMKNDSLSDFIIVGIHNISNIRHSDYFPKKPFESLPKHTQDSLFVEAKKNNLSLQTLNSDHYLKFLVEELKPVIDSQFPTRTERQHTFVMGSSMGGLISMYAISEYPEIFGGAACLSTHWIGTFTNTNNPIPNAFFDYMEARLPDAENHKLYFDYGTETLDALYLPYQKRVSEILSQKGHFINTKYDGAAHDEISWAKRLHVPLSYLLTNSKKK